MAGQGIHVDLRVTGKNRDLDRMNDAFERLQSAVSNVRDMMRMIASDAQRAARALNSVKPQAYRGAGGSRGGSRGGGASKGQPFQIQSVQHAMGILNNPQTAYHAASGNLSAMKHLRQARNIVGQHGKMFGAGDDFATRVGKLFMRSRYGGGGAGGLMPLGIDVLRLFTGGGMGGGAAGGAGAVAGAGGSPSNFAAASAAMGPLAIAAVLVAAKFKMVASSVNAYLTGGRNLGQGLAATGGDIGTFTKWQGIAKMMGLDPSEATAIIERNRSGIGAAALAGAGISPLGREFTTESDTSRVMKIVRHITTQPEAAARSFAEKTGTEKLLYLRNLRPETLESLEKVFERMADPRQVQATAEFDAAMVSLAAAWERLKSSAFAVRVVDGLTKMLEWTTTVMDLFTNMMRKVSEWIEAVLSKFGFGTGGQVDDWERRVTREHSEAMHEHSRIMKDHAEAIGGGSRTHGALPPGAGDNAVYGGMKTLRDLQWGLL